MAGITQPHVVGDDVYCYAEAEADVIADDADAGAYDTYTAGSTYEDEYASVSVDAGVVVDEHVEDTNAVGDAARVQHASTFATRRAGTHADAQHHFL